MKKLNKLNRVSVIWGQGLRVRDSLKPGLSIFRYDLVRGKKKVQLWLRLPKVTGSG